MTTTKPTLSAAEASIVADVRKTYLSASTAVQTEINNLVVGEQAFVAKHPILFAGACALTGAMAALLIVLL